MSDQINVEPLLDIFDEAKHDLRIFMHTVVGYVGEHPQLSSSLHPVIHSFKSRLKDREHLREKLLRKASEGRYITPENFFEEITDLAGVRILHLYQEQFSDIDAVIRRKVSDGDWFLAERPKAYTWDPETVQYFNQFNLDVSQKPTAYTSVHYVIKPRSDSKLCCELQIRTLFEEIWAEVDHQINYPAPSDIIACREQLKVLSKIVGAGSRLLDALRRVQQADKSQ